MSNNGAEAVPEQVRIAVHVGAWLVEVSLTAHTPLALVMEDLVPFLSATLSEEGLDIAFSVSGVYSLAPEGGAPFPRTETLADCGIVDGARLVLREIHSTEVFAPQIEDVSDAIAEFNAVKFSSFTAETARVLALISVIMFSVLSALLIVLAWCVVSRWIWWFPPAAALTSVLVVIAIIMVRRQSSATQLSYVLGIAALPLAGSAGWVAIPPLGNTQGQWTPANFMAAAAAVALTAFVVASWTKMGATVHSAAMVVAGFVGAAATALTFTGLDRRQVGTVAVLLGMILITTAPRIALLFARIRPPNLPVPGEDIDRNVLDEAALVVGAAEDEISNGVSTIMLSANEDATLERKSKLANKYLTGMFIGAVSAIVVGAVAAVRPGDHSYYGELAVVLLVVLSLLLRARSLLDRVQVIVFYCGTFVLMAGLAVVMMMNADRLVIMEGTLGTIGVLGICAVLGGILLGGAKLSPVGLRRIEQLEFMCILSIAPLAFWVTGIYSAVQH